MFENLVEYIEKGVDNFSPTIFYSAFELYFDPCEKHTIKEIFKKQKVNDFNKIDIDKLSWREVLAMFTYAYSVSNNLAFPHNCSDSGLFLKLAKRLKETDVAPTKGKFDDRKYYLLKNYVLAACEQSAISFQRVILKKPNVLWFLSGKELEEIEVKLNFLEGDEALLYLYAMQTNGHIVIFEPEYDGERLIVMLDKKDKGTEK